MRILVLSDSHGKFFNFKDAVEKHSDAEIIFFLGDGYSEYSDMKLLFPERKILAVKGNCDFCCPLPSFNFISAEQGKILYTHGDFYEVKLGLDRLIDAAEKNSARLVLFGHTHHSTAFYQNGIYYFNPGCLKYGEYGICDIVESGVSMTHLSLASL